jgi:membrane associated rhomboid family serine protease
MVPSMALSDRFYMRDSYNPPRASTWLIFILIGAFVLQCILLVYGGVDAGRHLALSRDGLLQGKIWQLLTFQFLHAAPMPFHVLFNCLGLYFFGRRVEEILGSRRFLAIYFLSGAAGGILQVLLTFIPRHMDIPVVGASAGVCGLIAIFCTLQPMEELQTWIYFFPITIRAHWFLKFLLGFSIFGALIPFDAIAHGAHLGGLLVGISFVRGGERWDRFLGWITRLFPSRKKQTTRYAKHMPWRGPRGKTAKPSEGYISREIDPILDKISAQGIESLTEDERQILEAARKMMK